MDQLKPWRRATAWWVLLVEGIVAAGLGAALYGRMMRRGGAPALLWQWCQATQGLLMLFSLLRGRRGNFALVRGAISLIVGVDA